MSKGYLWYTVVLLHIVHVFTQTDVVDVCDVDRLTLSNERQTGTIVFNGPYTAVQNPCVLRLQALPSSFIFIRPSNMFNFIWCSQRSMPPLCPPGCSYAYVFDGFYYNETLTRIVDNRWKGFNTSSSVLYVAVCHSSTTHVKMVLNYTTIGKL